MSRYLQRHVYQGSFLTLLVLVSLGLFFMFFSELDDIGRGEYRLLHAVQYMALRVPGKVVQFMPIAVLLGTILSLGTLASNSEIIAMQAAGYSVIHLLWAVLQAAFVMALLTFLIADWVVPMSETNAREIRSSAITATPAFRAKTGLWLKDENQVLYIGVLLPNGVARSIEIYQLDEKDRLISTIKADSAIPFGNQWLLKQVKQSFFSDDSIRTVEYAEKTYTGKISHRLLDVLMIEPGQMSSTDLYAYREFLRENNLDATVPDLRFWEKVIAPLTILVMCLLAVPFVLGSQRQSNTGQRLIFGILLGLGFMVADRLLIQLGSRIGISPVLNALSPTLLFLLIAVYLLYKKQSHN
jgi:lipopolysaccharide export system permease protein